MNEETLLVGALGAFFLVFGVFNWFHPFIGAIGVELRVDPSDLDVVRRTLARIVAVAMALVGLLLLTLAADATVP